MSAVAYESAFKGYRPWEDEPVASWRGANDLVHRLGGWKAFAGGKVPQDADAPAAAAGTKPAQPAATKTQSQAPAADPAHAGHKTK